MYSFNAYLKSVISGDQIVVDVDLGFNIWVHDKQIKLASIKECGPDSKVFLEKCFEQYPGMFKLHTFDHGQNGVIFLQDGGYALNLNKLLVDNGHATWSSAVSDLAKD